MNPGDVVDGQAVEVGEGAPLDVDRRQRRVVQDAVRNREERAEHAVFAALDDPARELRVPVPVRVGGVVDREDADQLNRHRGGLIGVRRDERQLVTDRQVHVRRDGIDHNHLERIGRAAGGRPRALSECGVVGQTVEEAEGRAISCLAAGHGRQRQRRSGQASAHDRSLQRRE